MSVVQPDSFLTLHYRLRGPDGTPFIDTFDAQPATLSLGSGAWSPALEQRLLGLAEGEQAAFDLPAGEAFGPWRAELVQWVSRALLDELGAGQTVTVGDVVQFPTPDGRGSYAGTAREVRADGAVCFDFNHPLAGQPVRLEVHIIGVL
jgi:FKBP-type peptidyl-prolyl cis-trans isomerase SlpA